MSTERDHGVGAHDAHGADAGPPGRPNVYRPQPGPAPSYAEYADPAAAHGWQNAYDETAELPAVQVPAAPAPREPVEGRADRRRQQRRTGGRRRRVILASTLGAAGTVAVIAVLAGGSDSPGPDRSGPAGGARVGAGDPATASPRTDTGSPAVTAPTAGGVSRPAAPSGSPAADVSRPRASGGPAASASAPATTASGPSASAGTDASPTTSASSSPRGWKHGHGGGRNHH
ncbi:hypothetical protein ACIRU3_00385 [Streptomyces sp. NPDC101151]|uniref:hypothetical protein n=1 Tax=Streptomyces sp. NPDC101151 TaxID=3366115 RepID=UPI00382D733F